MWQRYLTCTLGYGIAHKFAILWDGRVNSCDDRSRRPMLMGEKLSAFSLGLIYSPVLAPVWLMNDLDRLDIYMRGKRPEDYGYGPCRYREILDYVTG